MITRLNNNKFAILTEAIKGYTENYRFSTNSYHSLSVISDCGEVELTYEDKVDMLNDIATFKKDEELVIPTNINFNNISGLSNEIKSKLIKIRPRTLGQALRIDGVTPAAAILLLGYIKRKKRSATAW